MHREIQDKSRAAVKSRRKKMDPKVTRILIEKIEA